MDERLVDAVADPAAAVASAVEALAAGELVVLPTDTVYGLAADAFQPAATRRVHAAKRRSRGFPLPVLLRSPKQLLGLCAGVPDEVDLLVAAYWPGPLTIVVPAAPDLPWDLGDDHGALSVRMPLDDVAIAVIREVGPLAVTGANLAGRPAARTAQAAARQLGDRVAVYVDDGPRRGTTTSTIVDVTRGRPEVLREGSVPTADVLAVARGELDPLEAADRLAAGPGVGTMGTAVTEEAPPEHGLDDADDPPA